MARRISRTVYGHLMFLVAERIAQGGPCSCCEADWHDHQLVHRPGCEYMAYLDSFGEPA